MSEHTPVPEIDDVEVAFGTTKALPEWSKIPAEFKDTNKEAKWVRMVNDWFFNGISDLQMTPREGVDTKAALRAIAAHLRSFEPKHEHKTAGVAYLLSQWFEDATWSNGK